MGVNECEWIWMNMNGYGCVMATPVRLQMFHLVQKDTTYRAVTTKFYIVGHSIS